MQRADSFEKTLLLGKIEGRRRRGWQRMQQSDGITNLMDMSLSKLWVLVTESRAWHAAVQGVTKSRTWLRDWTELNWTHQSLPTHPSSNTITFRAKAATDKFCGAHEEWVSTCQLAPEFPHRHLTWLPLLVTPALMWGRGSTGALEKQTFLHYDNNRPKPLLLLEEN